LQQFRGLQAIIRLGSFSAAARDLGLTKASVWQQVRALEEEFGCKLVESLGRRAQPTPDGLRLARLSSPLVEGFDSIKAAFTAEQSEIGAALSVATTPSCLAHELRGTVLKVRDAFPQAQLTFQDRNSPAAIELLESGEADIAVAARFEEWPQKPKLDFLPLTEHPFAVVAPEGHPLMTSRKLKLTQLLDHPLLLPGPAANCRPRLEAVLKRERIWSKLQVVLECNFPTGLLEYVDARLGVAVTPVPASFFKGNALGPSRVPSRQTMVRSLSSLIGSEPVYFIRRRGWVETPIALFFREALFRYNFQR
jgi:molybdate transport repressor ModE-like protein